MMSVAGATMWRIASWAINFVSGEGLLKGRANGGTIIVLRAAFSASFISLVALALKSRLELGSVDTVFSGDQLLKDVAEALPWFGAAFAGVYAGLYARFSSQWSYLADLYNQIMAAQVQAPPRDENREVYTKWFAGFIDDAEALHLALKPSFASVIESLLQKPGVAEMYAGPGADGAAKLAKLRAGIARALEQENDVKLPAQVSR